jgi:predicted metalloprotease with PDZ domain
MPPRTRRSHVPLFAWFACLLVTLTVSAASPPAVSYIVSLDNPAAHLLDITLQLLPGPDDRELQLPVWNARYVVRDFSQYVNWVRGKDAAGKPLAIRKLDKSRWQVSGAADGGEIEYEVFANAPGPYGAELSTHHAFLNLAEVLMYPVDARAAPVNLRFTNLQSGWRVATILGGSLSDGYSAANYDELLDSPVEIGTFEESDFDEGGGHYRVAVDADPSDYDLHKVVAVVRKIVATETTWMNDRPFQTYLFLYHFPRQGPRGGMEHSNCTAIDVPAQSLKEGPLELAGVTAHEFFHLWNVKRIRPQSLEPVDYTKENYTDALWFSEGFSNTLEDYTLLWSGFLDGPQFLSRLAAAVGELQRRPAHATQSAEESSLDAWLEKYDYYESPWRSISYYNKGELLGVMLDLSLRDASHGGASLRDLFHWMDQHYAKQGKFFPDSAGVLEAADAVGQADFQDFFRKYVSGTSEIPWDDFFRSVGLHLSQQTVATLDPGFSATLGPYNAPYVVFVKPGSEAEQAGLRSGDSILEINGTPAGPGFAYRLAQFHSGDTLNVRIRNARGKRDLQWRMQSSQDVHFDLINVENITAEQKARRAAWLKGEDQLPGDRP